ncbi:MAG: hypothetical protein HUK21_04590 [Fibrobacteraceae bacterium]|nr:hypothetical protein [Fibrobacteraceae bacterium]
MKILFFNLLEKIGVASIAAISSLYAIIPNPNLSIGNNLYIEGDTTHNWKPGVYTDGILDFNQVSSMTDVALNVGTGPTKILVTWDTRGDEAWIGDEYVKAASCTHVVSKDASLQNFKIMTSANSTNGMDGDWEIALETGESGAMSRGVVVDFAGKSWVRLVPTEPVKNLEEIGVYDMSAGGNDTWFFMGTSISQMGLKQFTVDSNFSQLVHARFGDYYPAMIRGGIGCVTSQGVVDGLKYYAEYAGNVKFWAIEMGTNDAWGGSDDNVDVFKRNLQTIIDTAKALGITPIIARVMATNPEMAGWQVNQAFLDAVDELSQKNGLPLGPDFFDYFLKHPEELGSDGVHPANPKGGESMHRLWAEAVSELYKAGYGDEDKTEYVVPHVKHYEVPQIQVNNREIDVLSKDNFSVTILGLMGQVVESFSSSMVGKQAHFTTKAPAGSYVLVVRSRAKAVSIRINLR